jgi:hypothetical protein
MMTFNSEPGIPSPHFLRNPPQPLTLEPAGRGEGTGSQALDGFLGDERRSLEPEADFVSRSRHEEIPFVG